MAERWAGLALTLVGWADLARVGRRRCHPQRQARPFPRRPCRACRRQPMQAGNRERQREGVRMASYTVAKPGWATTPAQPAVAAGLASLDFDLPTPGVLYRFTTPQGDVEITARIFPATSCGRLIGIAAVAVGLLVLWFAARAIRRANVGSAAASDRRSGADLRRPGLALWRHPAAGGPGRNRGRLRAGNPSANPTNLMLRVP